jgi:hypothetical protein
MRYGEISYEREPNYRQVTAEVIPPTYAGFDEVCPAHV